MNQANSFAHDCRGVPVSGATPTAIEGLEKAIDAALAFRGDAVGMIEDVLQEHPDFVMGWLFKAGWMTQAMECPTSAPLEHSESIF